MLVNLAGRPDDLLIVGAGRRGTLARLAFPGPAWSWLHRAALQGRPAGAVRWAGRASGWLRASRGGLFAIALVVGAGSGLGAVAFRYLIYFFTWLSAGHVQFGQQGRVGSAHFPGLGLGFFVVIPVIGGLIYGPLIYRTPARPAATGCPR